MNISWKSKFSSRKFWAAIAAWITSLLTAFNASENVIARTVIIVSGIGALVVYMLAEAHVDAKREETGAILEAAVIKDDESALN